MTVSLWAYPTAYYSAFFCKSGWGSLDIDYRVFLYDGENKFSFICDSKDFEYPYNNIQNQWIHFAFIYQSGLFKIYKNGIQIVQQNVTLNNHGLNHYTDLYIGADPHGQIEYMHGQIDDIYIYNRALTDNEIYCLYSQACPQFDTITICEGYTVTLPNGQICSTDTSICGILPDSNSCDSFAFWKINVIHCEEDLIPEVSFNDSNNILDYLCDSVSIILDYNKGDTTLNAPYSITIYKDIYRGEIIRTYTVNTALQVNSSTQYLIKLPKDLLQTFYPISNLVFTLNDAGSGIAQNGGQQRESDTTNNILIVSISQIPSGYHIQLTGSICQGNPYIENGFNIPADSTTISGTKIFQQSLISSLGCDSIVTLQLTIYPQYNITFDIKACNFYEWDGQTYTESGNYTKHFFISYGCDSIITLNLTIIGLEIKITNSTEDFCDEYKVTLFASSNASDILWNTGERTSTITVYQPGTYQVTASASNCKVTDEITIKPCEFRFFVPNAFMPTDRMGANNYFSLVFKPAPPITNFEIFIFNRWGNIAFQSNDVYFKWDGSYKGEILLNATYNYIINYCLPTGEKRQKMGSITVL